MSVDRHEVGVYFVAFEVKEKIVYEALLVPGRHVRTRSIKINFIYAY